VYIYYTHTHKYLTIEISMRQANTESGSEEYRLHHLVCMCDMMMYLIVMGYEISAIIIRIP